MKSIVSFLISIFFVTGLLAQTSPRDTNPKSAITSRNKPTVEKYLEGFRRSDHAMVLSCLTDEVEWVIPGMFQVSGKIAFDKEIENEAFVGRPTITVTRMTEEANVVVVEGAVQANRKEGGKLNLVFCDVFEMKDGRIARLTSYLMELKK